MCVCVCVQLLSLVQFFVTVAYGLDYGPWTVVMGCLSWTVAHQVPLSVGFSGQEYWSGVPFPSAGDLPKPGIELVSLVAPALADKFFTPEPPGKSK